MTDTPPQSAGLRIRHLGIEPYVPVWEAMRAFTESRQPDTPDEIWCLQHEAVFTQGQAGKAEHVLDPRDIPVVQIDRGGQVTYHGPGQLVMYLMIDTRRRNFGPRHLVDLIEQSIMAVLAGYGLSAEVRSGAPGVYVQGAKIAALGLRIRRGCSYHGLSLNVDMDLEPFERINACGLADVRSVQLRDLLSSPPENLLARVESSLLAELGKALDPV